MPTKGRLVWGSSRGGSGEPPGAREIFQKICKKAMKIYNFLQILMENLPFFQNFRKILLYFRENLGNNLEKFRNMHLLGFRGGTPRSQRIQRTLSRKINGNLQVLIILMGILPFFNFFKFYRIILEKFVNSYEKFRNGHYYVVLAIFLKIKV